MLYITGNPDKEAMIIRGFIVVRVMVVMMVMEFIVSQAMVVMIVKGTIELPDGGVIVFK